MFAWLNRLFSKEPDAESRPSAWRSLTYTGKASSFADTRDVAAYRRALVSFLKAGFSQSRAEAKARKVGDPGIGWVDNDVATESVPWVALPYEDWQARYGTKGKAHRAKVAVTIGNQTEICILGDTMPHKAETHTGAVIDLAPGAQKIFGLRAPFMVPVTWRWAD